MSADQPRPGSYTELNHATITDSAIAVGTQSHASVVRVGDGGAWDRLRPSFDQVRSALAALDEDPDQAGVVAQVTGAMAGLEKEVKSPQPQRQRLAALVTTLMAVSADVVTLTAPVAVLVAAVRAQFGL